MKTKIIVSCRPKFILLNACLCHSAPWRGHQAWSVHILPFLFILPPFLWPVEHFLDSPASCWSFKRVICQPRPQLCVPPPLPMSRSQTPLPPSLPRPSPSASPKPLCFSQKETKSKYSYFLERPNCVVSLPQPFAVAVVVVAHVQRVNRWL